MKRFGHFHIILASLLLAAPNMAPVAHAQQTSVIADEQVDPQRLEAARAFLEASDFEQQMSEMLHSMNSIMEQMMGQKINALAERQGATELSSQQREKLRKISKQLSKALTDKFLEKQPELAELTTLVYARALTVEELTALTEFQKTPTGRKYNAACPEITVGILSRIMTGATRSKPVTSSDALDPKKEQAIEEMLEITQFDRTIDLMLEQLAQPTPTGALPPNLSKQRIEEFDASQKAMIEQFKLRKQELKPFVVSFWAKKLEIEDINATTSFFKTDIGQKILVSIPNIFTEQHKLEEKMLAIIFSDIGTTFQDIIKKHQSQK